LCPRNGTIALAHRCIEPSCEGASNRYDHTVFVADLRSHLDDRFPFEDAASWDPVGLQLGAPDDKIGTVAVCHEVNAAVVQQSIDSRVDTLVSYHPLLFDPVTAIVGGPTVSGMALSLIRAGVSLIIVHTAMDVAKGGTSDALLEKLGASPAGSFANADDAPESQLGRLGELVRDTTAGAFAETVSERLATPVRVAGAFGTPISRIAVVAGSGSDFIAEAATAADVFVTGDVSHHRANDALQRGLVVIDAGHIPTERPGIRQLYDSVRDFIPDAMFMTIDPHPWEDVSWKN